MPPTLPDRVVIFVGPTSRVQGPFTRAPLATDVTLIRVCTQETPNVAQPSSAAQPRRGRRRRPRGRVVRARLTRPRGRPSGPEPGPDVDAVPAAAAGPPGPPRAAGGLQL